MEHRAGRLDVAVPRLLFLEILNVAARRWHWPEKELVELADALQSLGFEVAEPPLDAVAAWAARGLSAYDACYVALAETRGVALVTTDAEIAAAAPSIARSLST